MYTIPFNRFFASLALCSLLLATAFSASIQSARAAGITLHNSGAFSVDMSAAGGVLNFPNQPVITAAIGEIVVVQVNTESVSGPVLTVTGVSDGTANVWHKRFSATQAPEPRFGASEGFEVWWTYVANTLTAANVNVTMSGATGDDAIVIVTGYQGFTGTAYQTNPWDANASLPKTTQDASGASLASASGISTNSTAGMLIAGHGSADNGTPPAAPTGFSLAAQLVNTGGTNAIQGSLFNEVYSSAQSSVTVTTQTNATVGWIFYVDALTNSSGGGGGAGTPARVTIQGKWVIAQGRFSI